MRRVSYMVGVDTLWPESVAAREQFATLTSGELVGVEITRPRHKKFNAKVYLTIERTAVAMRRSVRGLYGWLLVNTGRADVIAWPYDSTVVIVPHSVSDMDAVEFEAFWEDASALIRRSVLPYLPTDVAHEIARGLDVGPNAERGGM
jgi:hypothetical protein